MKDISIDMSFAQENYDGGVRRTITLTNLRDHKRDSASIYYEMVSEKDIPIPRTLDGYVMGIILYAMRLGQNVRVHGAMSAAAMRNLGQFQDAWRLWRKTYKKIEIVPDAILENATLTKKEGAFCAFSGGIDSLFTLLRHAHGSLGAESYPINESVLMVQGFDVPLDQPEQFQALVSRVSPLLDSLGLKLKIIRTNSKILGLQDWEDSFAAQLVSCMANYAHEFGTALIGSSEPYNALVLPWGSNPATDYLLSGAEMQVVHDGAGFSRTSKVEEVAKNPVAIQVAKVCWAGENTGTNCGTCEKCMRTRMNFLAVGVSHPACFETPLDERKIFGIDLSNDAQASEMATILAYVEDKGGKAAQASWVWKLRALLLRYRLTPPLLRRCLRGAAKAVRMLREGQWEAFARKLWNKALRRLPVS